MQYETLAAVDLGSNSFHLQIGRVEGGQIYPLDSLREVVRLGAGLTAEKRIDRATQARALEALRKFGERLRGLPRQAVRAVGTNALRVAKNAPQFLREARQVLGFPIEVIAGREEARLVYIGVAHALPAAARRLVQQHTGLDATRLERAKFGDHPAHGAARVQNVIHQQHVTTAHVEPQFLGENEIARFRARAVAGNPDEIEP